MSNIIINKYVEINFCVCLGDVDILTNEASTCDISENFSEGCASASNAAAGKSLVAQSSAAVTSNGNSRSSPLARRSRILPSKTFCVQNAN